MSPVVGGQGGCTRGKAERLASWTWESASIRVKNPSASGEATGSAVYIHPYGFGIDDVAAVTLYLEA